MSLAPGTRIGAYQIVASLGAGGMGEVYRAHDSRLGRNVALKIMPAAFAADPDRLMRFEREARTLAALNHPHIAQVFGIEETSGGSDAVGVGPAIVMELVEGDDLRARIARGPIPIQEALPIARQIAEALDAAHGAGIVHRDLKPANIRLRTDGTVKLLDFGLAKGTDDSKASDRESSFATRANTLEGVVLGTAAYMSPEQARGLAVDKRTDIWAFGCVLFEMLSARSPFAAATVSDTIAAVLVAEPDWTALPPATPPAVARSLKKCLSRDAKHRLRDLGDLDLAPDVPAPVVASRPQRSRLVWPSIVACLLLTAAAAVAIDRRFREQPAPAAAHVRFQIPVSTSTIPSISVSPDGRRLIYSGTGEDGVLRFWVRTLDALEPRPLSGSEGEIAPNTAPPFWSPDGRSIAFYAEGKIKTMDSAGGAPRVICEVPGVAVGGSWSRENVIVVGNTTGGLLQCSANGGEPPRPLTSAAVDPNVVNLCPQFLPDDRTVLYLRIFRGNPSENGLYVARLDRPADQQPVERVLETGFCASYVPGPAAAGHILFAREKTLWAVPFEPSRLTVSGDPVQVGSPVGSFRDAAFFSATPNVLVYREDAPDLQLHWRDRSGRDLDTVGEPGSYSAFALSPDATRAALLRELRVTRADQDLWLVDLSRDTTTRFTSEPFLESAPAWSADGQTVIFATGPGDILAKPLSGAPVRTLLARGASTSFRVNQLLTTMSATSDGRFLVFGASATAKTQSDLWVLSLGEPVKFAPLVQEPFDQGQPATSPDGRWLAYVSNESGSNQVFIRPLTTDSATGLPQVGAATLVSRGGGVAPRWRGDSRELFYQSGPAVMAVPLSSTGLDRPVELFRAPGMLSQWGVTADGKRFLVAVPVRQEALAPFTVDLNWQSALTRD